MHRVHRLFRTAPLPRQSLLRRLLAAIQLRKERTRLSALDAHILRDIGLSRHEAEAEARRAAWDVPDHWHSR